MHPGEIEGREYGPVELAIDRTAVTDFAFATGDTGTWSDEAPPSFAAVALFKVAPLLLADLGTDAGSVIHGDQTFAWTRPFLVGVTASVTGEVTRARERGGVHFVTFEHRVRDDDGEMGVGAATFLISGEAPAAGSTVERVEPEARDRGPDGESGRRSASRADLVRYAAASGDFNPVHWDHETAVRAGLGGVVVHGLLQTAWVLQAVPPPLSVARIRFRSPLPPATPVRVLTSPGDGAPSEVSVTDGTTVYVSARVEHG